MKKINVTMGIHCWFAWFGDIWEPGDLLGRGNTKEQAIFDLEIQAHGY